MSIYMKEFWDYDDQRHLICVANNWEEANAKFIQILKKEYCCNEVEAYIWLDLFDNLDTIIPFDGGLTR